VPGYAALRIQLVCTRIVGLTAMPVNDVGRIDDYALIGDGRTAPALISRDGSIEWLCLPRFDSGACCASILSSQRNGCWKIAPSQQATVSQSYQDDTLVLQTDFTQGSAAATLFDFMVLPLISRC